MTTLTNILLIAGLIFPLISWLTFIGSHLHQRRHNEYSSPVFIPFIGPLLLTTWIVISHKSPWYILVVWIADIGTLAFFYSTPELMRDWWRTSSFTRFLTLSGKKDDQSAIITFHSTGHYLLKKSWSRRTGQTGTVGLGEPGTFTQTDNQYEMTSHVGLKRVIRKTGEGTYMVDEKELPNADLLDYSLKQWELKV